MYRFPIYGLIIIWGEGSGLLCELPDVSVLSRELCSCLSWLQNPGRGYITLGLQMVQSKSYLCTLGPKVGIVYILGALG